MKYIGIDLGTTNSAICSYDGENTNIFKSPEQHDVTPSAIYIDKRGNKYVGSRAYNNATRSPDNSAILFKRFMGTSTKIKLKAIDKELTPEECSSEILKTLYGYLPEEIRDEDSSGTVITVPAAFNQMQKDATMNAAELANIGKVALMQEPVAAVMSVMKSRNSDGIFLIYDLGGGTLDVAIAESISGKVNLLSHGGIAMCGGRDFDRILFDNIVKPWLFENFNLPDDIAVNPKYKTLMRMAVWASEKAKIELSSKEDVIISLPETELNVHDLDGEDMYIDIELKRDKYDSLIKEKVLESVEATREALEKAGLTAHDVEKMVFVGGPTQYKPLRDLVSFELGISSSTDVNPMTAVAEGAALFAESIDWSSQNRGRKKSKNSMNTGLLDVKFNYEARTPKNQAKVIVKTGNKSTQGHEFQIDNVETGWTSGKMNLENNAIISLPLAKYGENIFKIFVFDQDSRAVSLSEETITISKTAASIDAIPASNSIGVEAKDKVGGSLVLDFLVKEGEQLPVKGQKIFKAEETLKAGSNNSIKFKLWEGEIVNPVNDNKFIGTFEIKGTDFDSGVITAGAELVVDYEMLDSGNIILEVSIPSIGSSFNSGRNFYSRDSGQIDYSNATKLIEDESNKIRERIEQIEEHVNDPKIESIKNKLSKISEVSKQEGDPEVAKQAMDDIQDAKKLLAQTKKDNLKVIRQIELDEAVESYSNLEEFAKAIDNSKFDNLRRSAQRAIDNKSDDFESYIEEIRSLEFDILWKQDWFIVGQFNYFIKNPHLFSAGDEFEQLQTIGLMAMEADDIDKLKQVIGQMYNLKISSFSQEDIIASSNIIRG